MKTKSLLLTAFLVVLGTLSSVADNDPKDTGLFVISGKGGMYKLIFEGAKPAAVNLTIYDSEGRLVYDETVRKMKGFIRPVNFKGMKADTYTILIRSGSQKYETKVAYAPESLLASVSTRNIDTNRYAILVSNTGVETIEVRIFDKDRNLITSYSEAVSGSFGKIFNLTETKSSSFTFEVYNSKGLIETIRF